MAQPDEVAALSETLRDAFETAWLAIVEEEEAIANDPRQGNRRRRLRELRTTVETHMASLETQAGVWFSEDFPVVYRMGADAASALLGEPFRWTTLDIQAVTELAQSGFDDLLQATEHVTETTKRFIRAVAKERALVGRIVGETARQSARRMTRELRGARISAITYANGAEHGLADYADMVIRTKTATAYNAAAVNLSRRSGVRFMECFDSANCGMSSHEDMEKPNGKLYPLDVASTYAISHPRCVRAWSPRPDVTTPEQASRAPSTIEALAES